MDYFATLVITPTIFLILLNILNLVLSLDIPKSIEPPKISYDGYTEIDSFRVKLVDSQTYSKNQFENEFVSKNGTDYVILEGTEMVLFTCHATYPVKWSYPFPEQLNYMAYPGLISSDTLQSDFKNDTPEPVSTLFISALVIHNMYVDFLSANFTCSAVEDKLQVPDSSIYIFLKAKLGIENEGQIVEVSINPLKTEVVGLAIDSLPPLVLPCRPAFPDWKLAIEKESATGNPGKNKSWERLNFPEKDLSFDPKIGFTLKRGLLGSKIFGLYRCSLITSNDNGQDPVLDTSQYVIINVTKTTNNSSKVDEIFEPRSNLKGKASVQFSMARRPIITCCSGVKDKPPKLIRQDCDSPLKCQLLKESILKAIDADKVHETKLFLGSFKYKPLTLASDCKREALRGITEVVVCRGENVDFMEEYIQIFHPLAAGPVTNRSMRISGPTRHKSILDLPRVSSLTKYETSSIADKAPIDQKMILLVGRSTDKKGGFWAPHILFDSQLRDLLVNAEVEINPNDLNGKLLLLNKVLNVSDAIIEYSRDEYYEGEPLIFMCFGISKFYSKAPHLRVIFENGTKMGLEFEESKKPRRVLYLREGGDMFAGQGRAAVSIFGNMVNASQKMTSVDCWMPRLNSGKWDKISKQIKVLKSVGPSFVEPEEENVYFYLGDVGNAITCTVKEAVPFPLVNIFRDGQPLNIDLKFLEHQTKDLKKEEKEMGFINGTKVMGKIDKEKNLIIFTINFDKIEIGQQGDFQCIAKNVNRTVIRTIHVFVTNKSGIALSITLTIAGILCVAIIGLGLKHWHDKRKVAFLQTNNK